MVEAVAVAAEISPCPFIHAGVEGAVTIEADEAATMEVVEVEVVGGAVVVAAAPVT